MGRLWNQCLVNLDFDDSKIRFETNYYISSVIRQEDFQKWQTQRQNQSQNWRKINKKKTSKRSVFQDLNFIGSICKVVGTLGFLCIIFFIYAPNHPKIILF